MGLALFDKLRINTMQANPYGNAFFCFYVKEGNKWELDCSSWDWQEILIAFHDEPVCTVTYYSHWQVMQKIKEEGFKVILSGLAADESLSGYYYYYLYNFLDLFNSGNSEMLKKEVSRA